MERIREALAKARSDKAFRDSHPVHNTNANTLPVSTESNDRTEPPNPTPDIEVEIEIVEEAAPSKLLEETNRRPLEAPVLPEIERVETAFQRDETSSDTPNAERPPEPATNGALGKRGRKWRAWTYGLFVLAIVAGATLAMVHVFFLPLKEVWLALVTESGPAYDLLSSQFQEAEIWAKDTLDMVLGWLETL